jgi:hypothetical protein
MIARRKLDAEPCLRAQPGQIYFLNRLTIGTQEYAEGQPMRNPRSPATPPMAPESIT